MFANSVLISKPLRRNPLRDAQHIHFHASISPLTIDRRVAAIAKRIQDNRITFVEASTGTGKSTRPPTAFIEQDFFNKIDVLVPKTVNTTDLTSRVGGTNVGGWVGYRNERETIICWTTRLVYKTYGVALAELITHPELADEVGRLILEQSHEMCRGDQMNRFFCFLMHRVLPSTRMKALVLTATMAPLCVQYLGGGTNPEIYKISASLKGNGEPNYSSAPVTKRFVVTMAEARTCTIMPHDCRMGWYQYDGEWCRKSGVLVYMPGEAEIFQLEEKLEAWRLDLDTTHVM